MSRPSYSRIDLLSLIFITVIAATLLNTSGVFGQSQGVPEVGGEQFLSIRSQRMTARNSENQVIFEEDVIITKGDLWMRADRVVVHFQPQDVPSETARPFVLENRSESTVDRIDAEGHVDIRQGTRKARADQAVYDQREEKIILTGHPEIWEENYRVTGKRMTFLLNEDRSVVEEGQMLLRDIGAAHQGDHAPSGGDNRLGKEK